MIKKQLEKIKDSKRKIENLVVLLIILIITFIAINKIWSGDSKESTKENNIQNTANKQLAAETNTNTTTDLQTNLENILTKISGVGKVKVLLTYYESSEIVPLYDETVSETTTEEADTSGGKRTTTDTSTQKSAVMQEEGSGQKNIITQKTVSPKIEGAIITAEGRR